ncbi:hypothetical protein BCV69DRAFT_80114 [Microstroma glucosiphilum]|uniref:Uncharacterized protein n=1 Tax=Pseudomicrostroma glucosiphilum TaxID=1684307 RepID=A0A316U5M9_9BASI|nr:hypothetical protein BCV69DRAFT_80114 [Pseudomicrostroma glucosiphilum]PWN18265.1 hypothetical protein BCV69DRAFT_80114 [Pseudomicrostroma glucosiphilum]
MVWLHSHGLLPLRPADRYLVAPHHLLFGVLHRCFSAHGPTSEPATYSADAFVIAGPRSKFQGCERSPRDGAVQWGSLSDQSTQGQWESFGKRMRHRDSGNPVDVLTNGGCHHQKSTEFGSI